MSTVASILLVLALVPTAAEEKPTAAEEEKPTAAEEEIKPPPSLLGEVTREQIEAAEPTWVAAQVESDVDSEAALGLATVDPEATLTVYLGTWCDDSKRELARFWRALDEAGFFDVEVRYLAIDRRDKRPPELAEQLDLHWVPTFIVERGGRELGRVVESAADTIERDLLALLSGESEGVLTGREDGAVWTEDGTAGEDGTAAGDVEQAGGDESSR